MATVTVAPANTTSTSFLSSTAPATTTAGTAVVAGDFSLRLLVDGTIVSDSAVAEMQTSVHKIPITQMVSLPAPDPLTSAAVAQKIPLQALRLPVKAVHWAGVLESNRLRNDHANFAGLGDPATATQRWPQGTTARGIFAKSQLFANNVPLTLKGGPDLFISREQAQHALRKPGRRMQVYSHHFCAGSPFAAQHNTYLDASQVQYLELRVDPDPALFADNSAVRGLDGTVDGTVAGGQKINLHVWAECVNWIIVQGGVASLAVQ
jgi:hypothetical protein